MIFIEIWIILSLMKMQRFNIICGLLVITMLFIECSINEPFSNEPQDMFPCPIEGEPSLEIGIPDPITFIDFQQLPSDGTGTIPLSSTGQSFLAIQLAMRAHNIGDSGYIDMVVAFRDSDNTLKETRNDVTIQERFFCRNDNARYIVPIVVSSLPLGDASVIDNQLVSVHTRIEDTEGREASAQIDGRLKWY